MTIVDLIVVLLAAVAVILFKWNPPFYEFVGVIAFALIVERLIRGERS